MDAAPRTLKPWVATGVVAVVVCALAVQRQGARDRLELGDPPVSALEPGARPRSAPVGSGAVPPPPPPSADETSLLPLTPELEAAAVETFTEARPGLLECLRGERARREGVMGKLPVALRVIDQGFVANVDLGASPVRSEDFDECATLTLAALVFPPGIAPRDVTITYDLR